MNREEQQQQDQEKMKIHKKYVVYELNRILGSDKHLALEKVQFKGYNPNSFDTEEEAIQAIIVDDKVYEDYVIIKEVSVRN